MSDAARNVQFERHEKAMPDGGDAIRTPGSAASGVAISGGTLTGVDAGVSDAQARETMAEDLRLWTGAGTPPKEAFAALASVAQGREWRT